jgi:hypothetical protein
MATGALWTDVDNDSDLDLLVTGEWEAIRLFRNDAGKLTDETVSSGLNSFRGWWTGVSAGDFDNDGDMDYVATNMGLNTKYHASDDHPYQIFFGDFDGSGERKLVEAEYEKETLFPVRGKSCSTHAMPFLAEKFSTYKDFAAASLEEIYTPECLSDSYKVSANWLPTSLLINDGEGRFTVKSLPNDAQISPGFGTVVSDLTGNGNLDIFIAQNFHSPQPETGNMDGGLGCLLEGDGAGNFVAVNPVDSGIVIPDDAMAATLTDDGMVVSVNNGSIRRLRRKSQVLKVRFADVESTTEIAGVRITARRGTTVQSLEVSAGNGYLTQQPPFLYFGSSASNEDWEIEATWLNGKSATFPIEADAKEFVIPPSE